MIRIHTRAATPHAVPATSPMTDVVSHAARSVVSVALDSSTKCRHDETDEPAGDDHRSCGSHDEAGDVDRVALRARCATRCAGESAERLDALCKPEPAEHRCDEGEVCTSCRSQRAARRAISPAAAIVIANTATGRWVST